MAEFEDKLNALLADPAAMERIAQMARAFTLDGGEAREETREASPPPPGDLFSALGGIDPQTIARFLPLLRELGETRESNARRLLLALRPYLKPERQEKVERALQLARLFRVGKKLLPGRDHDV